MKKIIFTLILLTTFNNTHASEKNFGIFTSTFTNHILGSGFRENETDTVKVPFNEDNRLTGIYIPVKDKFRFILGKGENSYFEDTHIIGLEFQYKATNYFSVGTDIAFASGYEGRKEVPLIIGDYAFMGGPHANFNIKKLNFKITLVPATFILGTVELRF